MSLLHLIALVLFLKLEISACFDSGTEFNGRIIGGSQAFPLYFPFMVLIISIEADKRRFLCAGSFISSKYILTAAHCTTG